jgi:hypothetical protein
MDPGRMPSSTDWLDDLESGNSDITAPIQSEERACCIYAVPETLRKNNGEDVYRPRVVSIGPHHWSDDAVQVMKKHKRHFLGLFLSRRNLGFNDLMQSIRPLEREARECYSREINLAAFKNDRFLKLMVLDGCFLIELFLKADQRKLFEFNNMAWAVPCIYGDLLLLNNQIPYFVLEKLFQTPDQNSDAPETSRMREESHDSLPLLALRFFDKVIQRPDGAIETFQRNPSPNNQKPFHLLDLVRSSFLIEAPENERNAQTTCRLIQRLSKLRRAGIKAKVRNAESFLDVKFRNSVIQMPNIIIDNNMKTFLLNCVALEHLHNSRYKHFTVYACFLDCLVDTRNDVAELCNRGIFDNYIGNHEDVAKFINKMGKDLSFTDNQFYLSRLFEDVGKRYLDKGKVQRARCRYMYFNRYFKAPWSFMSAVAAFVLLVLTFLQTYYTIYAYVNPKS